MRALRNIIQNISTHFPWNRYTFRYVEDIPEYPARRILYIVGSIKSSWLLFFKCPCGCDKVIHLNLMEDESPRWSYTMIRNRVNIAPSIHRLKGCKSHFWIKKGRIIWCFH
ncbi:DUF6527 family protein [Arenibacter sp. M-2]|uniref:DUF6527 family protein n=1 Tax=Arenibacter sp. M-2 TaxID=3053612 RepID=UPI003365265D